MPTCSLHLQIVHADCDGAPAPPLLYTCFVALQPVTHAMGPTRFVANTHADAAAFAAFEAAGDATGLDVAPDGFSPPLSYAGLLETGDASLYDARILHSGGSNQPPGSEDVPGQGGSGKLTGDGTGGEGSSAQPVTADDGLRVLFYLTFRHAGRPQVETDPASRSLLARLDGRVTLGMLRDESVAIGELV